MRKFYENPEQKIVREGSSAIDTARWGGGRLLASMSPFFVNGEKIEKRKCVSGRRIDGDPKMYVFELKPYSPAFVEAGEEEVLVGPSLNDPCGIGGGPRNPVRAILPGQSLVVMILSTVDRSYCGGDGPTGILIGGYHSTALKVARAVLAGGAPV